MSGGNSTPASITEIHVPEHFRAGNENWDRFQSAGGKLKLVTFVEGTPVLETTLELGNQLLTARWMGSHFLPDRPVILSHTGLQEGFFHVVRFSGQFKDVVYDRPGDPMQKPRNFPMFWKSPTASSTIQNRIIPACADGYTLEFTSPSPWTTTLLERPNFHGSPLPSEYLNKSVEELREAAPPITLTYPLPSDVYRALDASPELKTHPVLDRLVEDLGNDPLALANFVINEIGVTDTTRESTVSDFPQASLESQGVKRGALGVLLERQGSPVEQCGLLVYLLRRAGYEAVYAFPGKVEIENYDSDQDLGGIGLLDTDVSRLLGMQMAPLAAKAGPSGLIYANYPWVSVYLPAQTRWVNVFPWMKDVEIREGEDFWEAMPEAYGSPFKWIQAFLSNQQADGDLLRGDVATESPLKVLLRFFAKHLARTQPAKSISDFETTNTIRKHHYPDWDSLPRPWSIENQASVRFVDCLNKFDPNAEGLIFDEVSLCFGPNNLVKTLSRRVCDLHNRKLMVKALQRPTIAVLPDPKQFFNYKPVPDSSWKPMPASDADLWSEGKKGLKFESRSSFPRRASYETVDMPITGGKFEFEMVLGYQSVPAKLEVLRDGISLAGPEGLQNGKKQINVGSYNSARSKVKLRVTHEAGDVLFNMGGSPSYLDKLDGDKWAVINKTERKLSHSALFSKKAGETLILYGDEKLNTIIEILTDEKGGDYLTPERTGGMYWKVKSGITFQIKPSYPSITYDAGDGFHTTLLPKLAGGTSALEQQEIMTSDGFLQAGSWHYCDQRGFGPGSCMMSATFTPTAPGSLVFPVLCVTSVDKNGLLELIVNDSSLRTYVAAALVDSDPAKVAEKIVNANIRIEFKAPYQPVTVKWVLTKSQGDATVSAGIGPMLFVPDPQVQVQLEPFKSGANPENPEILDVPQDSSLRISTQYRRDRFLGMNAPQPETGKSGGKIEWGDTMALITSVDRVTDDMMREHLIAFQNTADPEKRREYLAYLMGMQYIKRLSDENDVWSKLLKIKDISTHIDGLSGFGADATGKAAYPILDMFSISRTAFQSSVRAKDNLVTDQKLRFSAAIPMTFNGSALEHITINKFFPDNAADAISTVGLLNQARAAGHSVVEIRTAEAKGLFAQMHYNTSNEEISDPKKFTPDDFTLQEWNQDQWSAVDRAMNNVHRESEWNWAFMTPGPVKSAGTAAWSSMGTFVNSYNEETKRLESVAIISPKRLLNGGYGNKINLLGDNSKLGSSFLDFQNGDVSVRDPLGDSYQAGAPAAASATGTLDYLKIPVAQYKPFPTPADLDVFGTGVNLMNVYGVYTTPPSTLDMFSYARDKFEDGQFARPEYSGNSGEIDPTVADPVNVMTGEFYNQLPDLVLPSPVPMAIVRNYSSNFNTVRNIGYGWRLGFEPSLILSDTDAASPAEIQASEMDGSLIQYSLVTAGGNVWKPTGDRNPLLNNSGTGIWSGFDKTITRTVENAGTAAQLVVYTLQDPEGSVRRYVVPGNLQKAADGVTVKIKRPLLRLWKDHLGNEMSFTYYGDNASDAVESADPGYGQLRKVQSSNGTSFVFRYNHLGMVSELAAGDGRTVRYHYNDDGDLVEVIRPDNSVFKYEYIKEKMQPQGSAVPLEYSTHLIWKEEKPDGRVVLNKYETDNATFNADDALIQPVDVTANGPKVTDKRRVIAQWSTPGKASVSGSSPWNSPAEESATPVLTAKFDYSHQTADMMTAVNDSTKQVPTGAVSGYTAVTDVYGRRTTYEYTDSKITRTIDPAGITLEQKWCTATDTSLGTYKDSVEWTIDRRGLKTSYFYNSQGKTIETITEGELDGDPASVEKIQTLYEYNALGLLQKTWMPNLVTGLARQRTTGAHGVIEGDVPAGNQSEITYDTVFPRLPWKTALKLPSGEITRLTVQEYSSVGAAPVIPFCRGVLMNQKTGDKNLLQNSQDFTSTSFQYEPSGFKKFQTAVTGTPDPNPSTTFKYNDRNELVEETDSSGYRRKYAYDDMGRNIWDESLDVDGRQLSWNYRYYNPNGELEWTDGPKSGAAEDFTYQRYDRLGNPIETVAWLSQVRGDASGIEQIPADGKYGVSWKRYNLFGEVVEEIDPLLRSRRTALDSIGRTLLQTTHESPAVDAPALSRISNSYTDVPAGTNPDPLGPPFKKLGSVVSTDALGGVTETRFTSGGRPSYKKLPDGRELKWRYYLDGRVKTEPVDHWFTQEHSYDDLTRTETVTLKGNGTTLRSTSRRVDSRGNVVSATDASAATTTTKYDSLNRPVQTLGPVDPVSPRRSTSVSYPDAAGRRTQTTDGLGNRTVAILDVLKRPSRTEQWQAGTGGGADQLVNVSTMEYDPDHHWVLSRAGTGSSPASPQMVSKAWSNTTGQPVLNQVLNAQGNVHAFSWTIYDAAGQAVRTRPAAGDSYITESAYDGMGRVREVRQPGGAVTRYRYALSHQTWIADEYSAQSFGMITRREMPDGQTEVSIQDAKGRPLRSYLVRGDGTSSEESPSRVVSGYHFVTTAGKDYGKLDEYTDARGMYRFFSYDNYGRLSSQDWRSKFQGSTTQVTTGYLYDSLDRVTVISQSNGSNNEAGTTVTRKYDSYGALVRERVTRGLVTLTSFSTADALYDADGRRIDLKAEFNTNPVQPIVSASSFNMPGGYHFDWTGNGNLQRVKSAAGNYEYAWSDSGQILWKYGQNPWWILNRDPNGRVLAKNSANVPDRYVLAKASASQMGPNPSSGGANLGLEAPFTISPPAGPYISQVVPLMEENMSWKADGLQESYQKSQTLLDGGESEDARLYDYDSRRKLASESYSVIPSGIGAIGGRRSMNYTFDDGRSNGLGVLTGLSSISDSSALMKVTSSTGVKSGQVRDLTLSSLPRYITSTGKAKGAGAVGLDIFPVLADGQRQPLDIYPARGLRPLLQAFAGPSDVSGDWSGVFRLEPGRYDLVATAVHPAGPASVSSSRSFTVMSKAARFQAGDNTLNYDSDGNVTSRGNQTLAWDPAGRLTMVREVDPVTQCGYLWKAQYDGLNRRIYTETSVLKPGGASLLLDQVQTIFDPAAEFLELGLSITRPSGASSSSREEVWKIHGPDLNGVYGGLMGTGGLEATLSNVRGVEQAWKDAFGHVFPMAQPSRQAIGYGLKPGSPALTISEGASVLQATGWRGRRADITGLICLGARYYSPAEGRFISPDPAGHDSSPSLYDFAGGDPVNFFDPDGRFARGENSDSGGFSSGLYDDNPWRDPTWQRPSEKWGAELPGLLNPPKEKIMTHAQWVDADAEGKARARGTMIADAANFFGRATGLSGESYIQSMENEDPGLQYLAQMGEMAAAFAFSLALDGAFGGSGRMPEGGATSWDQLALEGDSLAGNLSKTGRNLDLPKVSDSFETIGAFEDLGFYGVKNSAGGQVWVATREVNAAEIQRLAHTELPGQVNVIGGAHGNPLCHLSGFNDPVARSLGRLLQHSGTIDFIDMAKTSYSSLVTTLNGPGITVCGWCYSEVSVSVLKNLK